MEGEITWAAIVFLAISAIVFSVTRCTPVQGQAAGKALTFSAQTCEDIARRAGREDIATACHMAEGAAPILEQALEVQTCTIPDAGK